MLNAINLKAKHRIFSRPTTEVEHKTAHAADHAVLNVFETSRPAADFDLQFDAPTLISMIAGKKRMHLRNDHSFDFLPGESLIMAPSELMYIDFPEATHDTPTQCLALEINDGFIEDTVQWLNEFQPKVDDGEWTWTQDYFRLCNSDAVQDCLNRLIQVLVNQQYGRQLRAANTTFELIAALLQTHARHLLLTDTDLLSTRNRLAFVIRYIRKNLTQQHSIDELAKKAYLSRAQFFRAFKQELGETPVQFILRERVEMAKRLLRYKKCSITEACYQCGFSSLNYFSRTFRKYAGVSPTQWQAQQLRHFLA